MMLVAPLSMAEVPGNWIYEKITVDAFQKELYSATTRSCNSIKLSFPYTGLNHGLIMIRKFKDAEPEALFAVDKGQLFTGENIRVKFDDGNAEWIKVYAPSDRRTDLLFIADPINFINQIKNAKKLTVAVQFAPGGEKVFNFNLDGLDLARVGL
ncbi:MAG: hypothetical protein WCG19_00975 [Chlorobiaceae bacterium]